MNFNNKELAKDKILVSICCLAYNHENYIRQCLEGFLMQKTNFEFEILIHDDASLDHTTNIIREYEQKYPEIIKPIYQTENQYSNGVGVSVNFQFPRAKGKYIAMCEGDDYWTDPLKLQKQVDFLEANEEYVLTYSDIEAFDENGVLENMVGGAKRDLTSLELQQCTPINTLTTCFRNLVSALPHEMNVAKLGDLFLWSFIGAHGKGKYLGEIKPSRYRVHNGGIFSKQSKTIKQEMWLVTAGALYAYYCRIGNEKMKKYFHQKQLVASLTLFGVFPFIKYIFIKYFNLHK